MVSLDFGDEVSRARHRRRAAKHHAVLTRIKRDLHSLGGRVGVACVDLNGDEQILVPFWQGARLDHIEVRASAFADDLLAYLADTSQLPIFKAILSVYERGSGAKNSWGAKTLGMRLGASRDPADDPFPPDWDPQLVDFEQSL